MRGRALAVCAVLAGCSGEDRDGFDAPASDTRKAWTLVTASPARLVRTRIALDTTVPETLEEDAELGEVTLSEDGATLVYPRRNGERWQVIIRTPEATHVLDEEIAATAPDVYLAGRRVVYGRPTRSRIGSLW